MSLAGLKYYLGNPKKLFDFAASRGLLNWMSDEEFIKRKFKLTMGYELDLDNPKTFNEKLQWLKLYDRKPEYTRMVDKFEAKKYVSDIIGEQYIIPTLGVWDKAEDIDFDALPRQFVLKCTHDSGGVIVCRDKKKLDVEAARAKLGKCLERNYYLTTREYQYKNVKPRIIAEKYMSDAGSDCDGGELKDYKFFCFDGKVKLLYVCTQRNSAEGLCTTFFDLDWNRLPMQRVFRIDYSDIPKPDNLDEMVRIAEKLTKGIPFVRADLYDVDGHVYFGELTLCPGSGYEEIRPPEWERQVGDWITLPTKEGIEE